MDRNLKNGRRLCFSSMNVSDRARSLGVSILYMYSSFSCGQE